MATLEVLVLVVQSCVDSLRPRGLQPARLLCPWNSSNKNIGLGCHFLLQGMFPIQELNPSLQHRKQILYHLSHLRGENFKLEEKEQEKKIHVNFAYLHIV